MVQAKRSDETVLRDHEGLAMEKPMGSVCCAQVLTQRVDDRVPVSEMNADSRPAILPGCSRFRTCKE